MFAFDVQCHKSVVAHNHDEYGRRAKYHQAYRPTAADGSVVKDAAALKPGDRLTTRFAKGAATSVVA